MEKKGLVKTKMEEITCFAALQTVLNFKFQHAISMNKSKEFGFSGFVDSVKSVRFWVAKLQEMKIIPGSTIVILLLYVQNKMVK